jgi:group I intron endonuclease
MEKTFIYALTFNNEVRYVGKANDVETRFKGHFFEAYNPKNKSYNLPKSKWIRKHVNIAYKILEECTFDNWAEREIYWISNFTNLLNLSKGGFGGSKPVMSEETKKKISEIHKGRKASEETKLKMSLKRKGVKKDWMKLSGEKNYNAKPVYQYSLEGDFIKEWSYQREAAYYYNVKPASLNGCVKNRQKTCANFIWKDFKTDKL